MGMSEQTIAQLTEKPPLYWEAVAYCEEHGLSREDVERARTMLAVREFMRRIEPYRKQAARLLSAEPSKRIMSEGYMRADISLETDKALKTIQDMIHYEAEKLGLSVPARQPTDT
jgi:hypothetical protein